MYRKPKTFIKKIRTNSQLQLTSIRLVEGGVNMEDLRKKHTKGYKKKIL